MENEVMVSISCITYNHENYIADTIDSFLMQKMGFNYEILIHDDASTDKTVEIVKKYEKKYPDIIKPIYQLENQYSKGIKVGKFNRERAKGKYIAACEGDDYWIDPYKLHKQLKYMENHPECSMCFHAAYGVDPKNKKVKKYIRPNIGNRIFTVEEIIEGGGGLFATNSMMYLAKRGITRPMFFENAPVGDYPSAIFLALQGTIYYIDEFMSAYRIGVIGSWTSMMKTNIYLREQHIEQIERMLEQVNIYTNNIYMKSINKHILKNRFNLILLQGRFKDIKNCEYKKIYEGLGIKVKVIIFIKQYFPIIIKFFKSIKRIYKKL